MEEIRNLLGSELKSEIENLSKLTQQYTALREGLKPSFQIQILRGSCYFVL